MIAIVLFGYALYVFLEPAKHQVPSWKAVQKSTHLPKGHYDVIIVGGGVGGLTSGALLTKNGYKVLITEKNPDIGGFCSRHTEKGFTFGYGAGDVNGIWERGPVTHLLNELSLKQKDLFVKNSRRFFVADTSFDVGNGLSFEQALMQQFGEEKEAISKFFKKAKIVYEETYDKVMIDRWGTIVPEELIPTAMPKEWVSEYPPAHKELLEWKHKSYQEVLDEYFKSTKLKKVMSSILKHLGGIPVKTMASDVVVHTFGYFFFGGYQPLKTSFHFAKTIASYITKHGGTILTNSAVDTILVEGGAVRGVQIGKKSFYAPVVISDVNAKTTYLDLVDNGLSIEFLKSIRQIPMGKSTFALYLGVDRDLSAYPSLLQDRYNQVYIANLSRNDPTLAPEGKSAVVLRETARISDFMGKTPSQYEKYVQKRADALLQKGIALVPELRDNISLMVVRTPKDFERLVDMPQGSIYGFDLTRVSNWPYFKSPIRGLYLVGASTSGPGITPVVGGGILCAQDIMGWKSR